MTDEQREVLAVELLDLRIQARQTIPQMAEVYAQCTRNLNDTRHYQDGAFDNTVNPNLFAPGGVALPSAVYPHWVRLRDELQSILAATAENLNLTALALEAIADGYAAQDASAARELERISGELPAEVPVHPPEHPGNPEHDDSLERPR